MNSDNSNWNFAGRLVKRLVASSRLVDASTGGLIRGNEISSLILAQAQTFLSAGLSPSDRVIISCRLDLRCAVAYLAAMYAGLVPVLVEEMATSARATYVAAKSGAKAVWASEANSSLIRETPGVSHMIGTKETSAALPPEPALRERDDLAALMPTSGSTGESQLVKVTHGNLLANTEAIIRSQQLTDADTAMLILPLSYCFGASIMHTHLYCGGGVVFDSRFMFPDKVLHAITKFDCTTFAGVPSVYNILLRRSNIRSIPLQSLRRFLQAGGALAVERVGEMQVIVPHAQFYVMYGQTEATARISCLPPECLADKMGSVGLPLDNVLVRIVDDFGHELPAGALGEIQARGPSICLGYFENPEATGRKFIDGWLNTGDYGFRDEDGYLWIRGRRNEFVKIRGRRVGLAQVEARVAAIPGVYECAAVGIEHPEAGEALAIFIVSESGTKGVCENVRRTLPPEWTCASVSVVSALPKTANGKIARRELPIL